MALWDDLLAWQNGQPTSWVGYIPNIWSWSSTLKFKKFWMLNSKEMRSSQCLLVLPAIGDEQNQSTRENASSDLPTKLNVQISWKLSFCIKPNMEQTARFWAESSLSIHIGTHLVTKHSMAIFSRRTIPHRVVNLRLDRYHGGYSCDGYHKSLTRCDPASVSQNMKMLITFRSTLDCTHSPLTATK